MATEVPIEGLYHKPNNKFSTRNPIYETAFESAKAVLNSFNFFRLLDEDTNPKPTNSIVMQNEKDVIYKRRFEIADIRELNVQRRGSAVINRTSSVPLEMVSFPPMHFSSVDGTQEEVKTISSNRIVISLIESFPMEHSSHINIYIDNSEKYYGLWAVDHVSSDGYLFTCSNRIAEASLSEVTGVILRREFVPSVDNQYRPSVRLAPPLEMEIRATLYSIADISSLDQTYEIDILTELILPRICDGGDPSDRALVDALLKLYHFDPRTVLDMLNTKARHSQTETWTTLHVNKHSPTYYDFQLRMRRRAVVNDTMRMVSFPYDRQHLHARFAVKAPTTKVRLRINESNPSLFQRQNFALDNVFGIPYGNRLHAALQLSDPDDSPSGRVTPVCVFSLTIDRKPTFFLVNVIMPTAAITYMCALGFSVDEEGFGLETGERLLYNVTLLLTLVAFKFSVADMVPRVSYLTALDTFEQVSFLFVIAMCIECSAYPSLVHYHYQPLEESTILKGLLVAYSIFVVMWFGVMAYRMYSRRVRNFKSDDEKFRNSQLVRN